MLDYFKNILQIFTFLWILLDLCNTKFAKQYIIFSIFCNMNIFLIFFIIFHHFADFFILKKLFFHHFADFFIDKYINQDQQILS
jgi:hypothetical protein